METAHLERDTRLGQRLHGYKTVLMLQCQSLGISHRADVFADRLGTPDRAAEALLSQGAAAAQGPSLVIKQHSPRPTGAEAAEACSEGLVLGHLSSAPLLILGGQGEPTKGIGWTQPT